MVTPNPSVPSRAPTPPRRFATLLLASLALAVSTLAAACAPPARSEALPALVLDGRGYGHGVGLSQWGAYGMAVNGRQSWQQILGHYYGGTALTAAAASDFAPLPAGHMSVRLQGLDDRPVSLLQPRGQARIAADPVAGRTWSAVAIREVSGQPNRYRVWALPAAGCAGPAPTLGSPWTLVADGVAGPVTVTASAGGGAFSSAADLLGVCQPNGDVRYYRGAIQAVNGGLGEDRAVNLVPIELYLRSVVSNEMSGSWGSAGGGAGMHALRAQAVAARSYALSETSSGTPGLKYSYAKTCDVGCQYYPGAAVGRGTATPTSLEDLRAIAAVDETGGIVLRDARGRVTHAYFSASSGGRTAIGPYPVVDDPHDGTPENPNHRWRVAIPAASVEAKWPQIGQFTGAVVVGRDGAGGDWGGRVTALQLRGTAGTVTVSGAAARSALALKSTWFAVSG